MKVLGDKGFPSNRRGSIEMKKTLKAMTEDGSILVRNTDHDYKFCVAAEIEGHGWKPISWRTDHDAALGVVTDQTKRIGKVVGHGAAGTSTRISGKLLRVEIFPVLSDEDAEKLTTMTKDDAKAAKPSKKAAKPSKKAAKPKKEATEAKPKAKRVRTPKLCGCGCGQMTKGGDFIPGHDAKLFSALIKVVDGKTGDEATQAIPEEHRSHVMFCGRCGKLAMFHESGIGPVCRKRMAQMAVILAGDGEASDEE